MGVVVFIMGLDLLGGANDLAVQRVGRTLFELDGDGLVHCLGHDITATNLAEVALCSISHAYFSSDLVSVASGS